MTHKPEAIAAFVQEARELLAAMEVILLQIEHDGVDKAGIDAVFRAVHTIKGSASIFAFEQIVDFTHITENVLDKIRTQTITLDEDLRVLLLACNDYISSQIDTIAFAKEEQPADSARRRGLEEKLRACLDAIGKTRSVMQAESASVTEVKLPVVQRKHTDVAAKTPHWYLSLRFDRDIFLYGLNPIAFVQHLCTFGVVCDIRVIDDFLPEKQLFNPEQCYIGFEIVFQSQATHSEIVDVFSLMNDLGSMIVIAPHSDIDAYRDVLVNFNHPRNCVQVLTEMQVLDRQEMALFVEGIQYVGDEASLPEAPIVQAVRDVQTADALTSVAHQDTEARPVSVAAQETSTRDMSENQFIKIQVDRLDQLIDLVGELVIAGATATLVAKKKQDARYQETTEAIAGLVGQIRDAALAFRMVRMNEIFQRFPRVIRETASALGKEVALVMTGEDTELDKSMLEKIANPLMHLVRNAVDHGIESTEARLAAGKEKKGTITLHARNESGSIVIEISDDGKGMDQQKIVEKAIEKGLLQPEQILTPAEILNMVFAPGFSTAEKVTAISGRGVGMDVVKKNIDELHGTVTIHSVPGAGTTMHIRLPMTLAIIDGFQVTVGSMVFVLPLDRVVECINLANHPVEHNIVTLRDTVVSFIDMRRMFGLPVTERARQNVLIVDYAQQQIGLLVDAFEGECQAVVKPMNTLFARKKGFSGSALLGDGRIALVLDIAHLAEHARKIEHDALEMGQQQIR
jgi:two-component system chemotaxis sensor kinase CheA